MRGRVRKRKFGVGANRFAAFVVAVEVKRTFEITFVEIMNGLKPVVRTGKVMVDNAWIPFVTGCEDNMWEFIKFLVRMRNKFHVG